MTAQAKQLADRFAESNGRPIEFEGRELKLAMDFEIAGQTEVTIAFVRAALAPVQGVCLKMTSGTLDVEGQTSAGMVLWEDAAPQTVSITINVTRRSKRAPSLRIWNAWKGRHGETQAWIGNSGLWVEDAGPGHSRLWCSDGPGQPDFESLILDIHFGPQTVK